MNTRFASNLPSRKSFNPMRNSVLGSWTVRIALGLALLYGLQLFPYAGLVIMMFGMALAGPYVWGFLPHLITIGLICDVSQKRFSRKALLVPVLGYASYYAFFNHELAAIHAVEDRLKAENAKQAIDFDPSRHALVMKGGEGLVTYNKVAVAYEENSGFPEGHQSYRLISAQRCKDVRDVERESFDFDLFGVHWQRGEGSLNSKFLEQCQLRTRERPKKDIVKISTTENKKIINGTEVFETTHVVVAGNKTVGVIKDAFAMRLPAFPFIIVGCGPSHSSWDCRVGFYRSRYLLAIADSAAIEKYGMNSIANVLKLEKYKESDFSDFKDYPENVAFVEGWLNAKKSETAEDFNEWGVRKDSPYIPQIEYAGDVESYKGVIYSRKQGGPFYDFIRRNDGKTVFIDATLGEGVNRGQNGFGTFAICKEERACGRVEHWYRLMNGNTDVRLSDRITGYWKVSTSGVFPDSGTPIGNTRNVLTVVESAK